MVTKLVIFKKAAIVWFNTVLRNVKRQSDLSDTSDRSDQSVRRRAGYGRARAALYRP